MPQAERPFMPGYGVPEDARDVLPWGWAEERLLRSRNFWVVTASAQARPHAMPVWGIWLAQQETFAFSCSPESRKARNIAENPQVVVGTEDTVECVSVEGRARPCSGAALDLAAAAWAAKYEADDAARAELERFFRRNAAFEVVPERAFGIIERAEDFSRRATRWTWPTRAGDSSPAR